MTIEAPARRRTTGSIFLNLYPAIPPFCARTRGEDRLIAYLDFEVELGSGAWPDYSVRVVQSPAGEARESLRFPSDQESLRIKLDKLENAVTLLGPIVSTKEAERNAMDFGATLFSVLMRGEVRNRYDVSLQQAQDRGKGLRLKLRIQASEVALLPWEFLYDERRATFLSLSPETPVVRYVELRQPLGPMSVRPPLHLLGMISNPPDFPLMADRERDYVNAAFEGSHRKLVDLSWIPTGSWRDLQKAIRRGTWHVFHFIGHGTFDQDKNEGSILLSDEHGRDLVMSATQLGRLLVRNRNLRLVTLNACESGRVGTREVFSSAAAVLVRSGIPAVVAMQYCISDTAAIEFSRSFYEALADGLPVDASMAEARVAISLAVPDTLEWAAPVLYMHVPDGVLFRVGQKSPLRGGRVPS